jgi:hypothetical protein
MTLQEKDLEKIYQWLLNKLTDENRNWLEILKGWKWNDNIPTKRGIFKNRSERFSCMIRDILDCKKNRRCSSYLEDCLPKEYVIELARLCNVDFSKSDKKELIFSSILLKIKEESQ